MQILNQNLNFSINWKTTLKQLQKFEFFGNVLKNQIVIFSTLIANLIFKKICKNVDQKFNVGFIFCEKSEK